MLKRSNLLLLAVSVVLAFGTTLVVVEELSAHAPSVNTGTQSAATIPTEQVVVVKTSLPNHTEITAKDVELKQVPTSAVAPGTATQLSQVVGKYTATNWVPGQQVLTAMYGTANSASFSQVIPSGEVAFTISDSPVIGVDHLIQPGDHINILDYQGSNKFTTLSNLKVLFVDQVQAGANPNTKGSSGSGADTLTVAVTSQQAQTLAEMEASGQIHIVLQKSSSTQK